MAYRYEKGKLVKVEKGEKAQPKPAQREPEPMQEDSEQTKRRQRRPDISE